MQILNTDSGAYPLTERDVREAMPNTSFPFPFVPPEPYVSVAPSPTPAHDATIRRVQQIAPELVDGVWTQRWEIVPRFVEYIDADNVVHTVAEQEAAAIAAKQAADQAALINSYDQALTDHLDAKARERRYDNRITCALRAGFAGPFHAEGVAFAQWMDACNAAAYQIMSDVMANLRPIPTVSEFLGELPALTWPT